MEFGIPKEARDFQSESRVGLTPGGVMGLVRMGHTVYVEKDAGVGSGIADQEFVKTGAVLLDTADEVWSQADMVIKVKEPLEPEFKRMKEGVYLINTARGELIDEAALKEALDTGRLKGAALDVFEAEPLNKNHFLLQYPQVILTPHIAAHTDQAMNQMGWSALKDCLAVLRGERPEHVVNPEVYKQ